ncbi:MAG: hypothetical protein K1060chlam3_00616 [Candidatus Anoxychlamydiales bacterium]|nr:hypothetical protein [Candidatus Anoxychlamydiales bacterium]
MVQPVAEKKQWVSPVAIAANTQQEIKVEIKDPFSGVTYCCKGTFQASRTSNNLPQESRIRSMLKNGFPPIKNVECTAIDPYYFDPKDSLVE